LTTPENTITYHNALRLSPQNFAQALFSVSSWGHFNSQEKLKTMLMQNFGVTNEEHCGMLWYFLELAIGKCTHEPFPAKLILHTKHVALHAAALGLIRVFITSRGVGRDFSIFFFSNLH